MASYPYNDRDRPRVLIAGGGVAALEASLFIREFLSDDEVDVDLLTPALDFSYRPLSVLEAFDGSRTWSMPLDRFASDQDIGLVRDALARVLPEERVVETTSGARQSYDALLIAVGGTARPYLSGAITFRGAADAPAIRRILDEASARRPRVVFAAGSAMSWPLPLYELALLTARELHRRAARAELALVTPEARPLGLFGPPASERVAALLRRHDIATVLNAEPLSFADGELRLVNGRTVAATHVVALPRVAGRFIEGLPQDSAGFVPIDGHGRVPGHDRVYAAGDITTFPFKHGGLATQQADAAAEAILADLGYPIEPRPFSPVLEGFLFTGDAPTYMRRPLGRGAAAPSEPRSYGLWWPPTKIAGRFLSPYLTVRAGAPRTPEVRPPSDVVPVRLDLADAIARGAGPIPAD